MKNKATEVMVFIAIAVFAVVLSRFINIPQPAQMYFDTALGIFAIGYFFARSGKMEMEGVKKSKIANAMIFMGLLVGIASLIYILVMAPVPNYVISFPVVGMVLIMSSRFFRKSV